MSWFKAKYIRFAHESVVWAEFAGVAHLCSTMHQPGQLRAWHWTLLKPHSLAGVLFDAGCWLGASVLLHMGLSMASICG